MYWVLLIFVVLLTGSGAVGSDAFLIGILLGSLLCVVGLALVGGAGSKENHKEDDK